MLQADLPAHSAEQILSAKIATAVRDLDAVVGDVLAFAREMKLRPAVVESEALLCRAREACEGLAAQCAVAIEIAPPQPEAAEFTCDHSLVLQAVVNLVRNGVQAAAETAAESGRMVRLSAHAPADGGEIALRIDDTGPGAPPEAIERMFNPFFTTRATGAGLGLAIVHRIADAHGGRVIVPYKPAAAGAMVELRLPRNPPTRATGRPGRERAP
jgi:two-component system sensor histidine kinase AtoS